MNRLPIFVSMLLLVLLVAGCASQDVNRDVYKMLQDRECVRDMDVPGCDRGQPGYEDYREARDSLKKE